MLFLYYHQQLQQSLKAALVLFFFFEYFKNFLLYDILLKIIPVSRLGDIYYILLILEYYPLPIFYYFLYVKCSLSFLTK